MDKKPVLQEKRESADALICGVLKQLNSEQKTMALGIITGFELASNDKKPEQGE